MDAKPAWQAAGHKLSSETICLWQGNLRCAGMGTVPHPVHMNLQQMHGSLGDHCQDALTAQARVVAGTNSLMQSGLASTPEACA